MGAVEDVGLGHTVVVPRGTGEAADEGCRYGIAVLRVGELGLIVVVEHGSVGVRPCHSRAGGAIAEARLRPVGIVEVERAARPVEAIA